MAKQLSQISVYHFMTYIYFWYSDPQNTLIAFQLILGVKKARSHGVREILEFAQIRRVF